MTGTNSERRGIASETAEGRYDGFRSVALIVPSAGSSPGGTIYPQTRIYFKIYFNICSNYSIYPRRSLPPPFDGGLRRSYGGFCQAAFRIDRPGHEKTLLSRQIEATDRQIDALVYERYGLTEEYIATLRTPTGESAAPAPGVLSSGLSQAVRRPALPRRAVVLRDRDGKEEYGGGDVGPVEGHKSAGGARGGRGGLSPPGIYFRLHFNIQI